MLNFIHDVASVPEKSVVIDPTIADSKRLQMFYVSVKEGSFAGAAKILSLSPSAISHAMKSLEEDLGCSLFRRFGPQVKPTGAAVRLLPMVEDLLMRMASMKRELLLLGGRSERLAVRVSSGLLGMFRVEVLSSFYECFPAADLEIAVREAEGMTAQTRGFDLDIDYLESVPSEMVRRDLGSERYRGYVAPFHRLGQSTRVSMAELRQNLLVLPDPLVFEKLAKQIGQGNEVDLKKWILPGPGLAREMAQQGQCVAFLPGWAVESALADGSLVALKLPGLELQRTICARWDPFRPLTWVAEVFLSLFSETMEGSTRP